MDTRVRDFLIQAAATIAAFVLGQVLHPLVADRWEWLLIVALVVGANVAIKAAMPAHAILTRVSWIYLGATGFILLVAAYVFGDPDIFWLWKIPILILIFLGWCVVHLLYGAPEKDDEGAASG